MRIAFFGTPEFAIPSLTALLQSEEEVTVVVTRTDKRKGRSHVSSFSPVKKFALDRGIKILQPVYINDPLFIDELSTLKPDIIVVVAYGKILPTQILRLPGLAVSMYMRRYYRNTGEQPRYNGRS